MTSNPFLYCQYSFCGSCIEVGETNLHPTLAGLYISEKQKLHALSKKRLAKG
jgi:hypothetical protein